MHRLSNNKAGTASGSGESIIVISGFTTPSTIDASAVLFTSDTAGKPLKKEKMMKKAHRTTGTYPFLCFVSDSTRRTRRNPLKLSVANTTRYNTQRIMPTLEYSRQASFSFSKRPMPPAPTKPNTAALRTLDSNRYSRLAR